MCNAEIIDPIIDLHRKKNRHPHRQPSDQAVQVEGRQRRHRLAPMAPAPRHRRQPQEEARHLPPATRRRPPLLPRLQRLHHGHARRHSALARQRHRPLPLHQALLRAVSVA